MPKYEYICDECGHTFTETHLYKEVLAECPECNALDTLNKVLNTPVNLSSKPGMVVNDAIASAKQEMEAHKEELKNNREANSDD